MVQKKGSKVETEIQEVKTDEEVEKKLAAEGRSMVQSLKEFIQQCPHLEKYKNLFPVVTVDKLPENVTSYMIMPVPAEPWIKKYIDGTGKKQFLFNFSSRAFYSTDEKTNVKNNEFFEQFADWLNECTRKKLFPKLKEGQTAYKITATTSGYLFNESETKAQYQIQCRLEYYQSN